MQPSAISVVMPVLDGARYLAQAIESVLSQTAPPGEIVVVEGGSADRSAAVAASYPDVRVVAQRSTGLADAWNEGVAATTGSLLAFLDSDDVWLEDKLARQLEAIADPSVDYVITMARFFREEGMELPATFRPHLLDTDHVANMPSALLVRRPAFERVGPFRPELGISTDIDWFARAKDLPLTLAVVAKTLVLKRVHDRNLSHSAPADYGPQLLHLLRASVHRQER